MKNRIQLLLVVSVAAALAGSVVQAHGGPPVAGGAHGAGNLGIGPGNPGMGAVNGVPRGSGAAFGDGESIGMRQERLRAQSGVKAADTNNADAHASVMGEAHGRSVATLAAGGASGSLKTAEMVHAIQAQARASREQLLAELHTRVDASAKAMAGLRKASAKLDGDAKKDFVAASADVKAKEKVLKKSLKAAEKADADAWGDARAKLATDYDAYAAAVAHAEAASRMEANPAEKPKG